jgi:hypothetical protein
MSHAADTLGPLPEHWRRHLKYYDKQGNDGWYDQSRVPDEQKTLMCKVGSKGGSHGQPRGTGIGCECFRGGVLL